MPLALPETEKCNLRRLLVSVIDACGSAHNGAIPIRLGALIQMLMASYDNLLGHERRNRRAEKRCLFEAPTFKTKSGAYNCDRGGAHSDGDGVISRREARG